VHAVAALGRDPSGDAEELGEVEGVIVLSDVDDPLGRVAGFHIDGYRDLEQQWLVGA